MYQQGGPFLAMRGPFITAAGGSSSAVMSPAAVIDGTDIDVTFTTQIDLLTSDGGSPGVVGFYWSIGEGVAATNWQDVAADESFNHAFSVPLATIGAVAGDVINIDPGYSLTSPYSTIVSGSDSGAYVTPVVYVVAVDDTTPTEGVQIAMNYDYVIGPPAQVLTYRWQSSDGPSTVGTLQTYTPDAGDVGFTLTARVTSTLGSLSGFDDSAATAAVVSAATLEIVGTAGSVGGNSTTKSVTGFTTTAAGRIFAFIRLNSGVVTGVTDNAGADIGAWSFVGKATATSGVEVWTAVATAAVTSIQVDVAFSLAPGYSTVTLCCVKDADTSGTFLNGSVVTDTTKPADPSSITTTVADTIIFGCFYMDSVANPTASGIWTNISPGATNYLATLYQIVSATGTYGPTLSTGATDSGRSITFAVKKA